MRRGLCLSYSLTPRWDFSKTCAHHSRFKLLMTEIGQNRKSSERANVFRFALKADASEPCRHFRKRHALFDHLVGEGEQRRWRFKAKRFRGLEIDDEFVLRRCLHR
jgi:hypothetical protein